MFASRLTSKTTSDAATKRPVEWVIVSAGTSLLAGRHTNALDALNARIARDDAMGDKTTTYVEVEPGVFRLMVAYRHGAPLTYDVIAIRY